MLALKILFDLRYRLLFALALVVFSVVGTLGAFMARTSASQVATVDSAVTAIMQYRRFIDTVWLGNSGGTFALCAILLATGSVLSEQRTRVGLLTFSLPITRRRWVSTHVAVCLALLCALSFVACALIVIAGRAVTGVAYPPWLAISGALRLAAAAAPWVGMAALLSVLVRNSSAGVAVLLALVVALSPTMIGMPPVWVRILQTWAPSAIATPGAWTDGTPWRALVVLIVSAVGTTALAAHQLERADL